MSLCKQELCEQILTKSPQDANTLSNTLYCCFR